MSVRVLLIIDGPSLPHHHTVHTSQQYQVYFGEAALRPPSTCRQTVIEQRIGLDGSLTIIKSKPAAVGMHNP
jgi:hypothetical protein